MLPYSVGPPFHANPSKINTKTIFVCNTLGCHLKMERVRNLFLINLLKQREKNDQKQILVKSLLGVVPLAIQQCDGKSLIL